MKSTKWNKPLTHEGLAPPKMFLFFYYPSDEYISYLMTVDELAFLDEIDCRDLFDGENPRERIMIFEVAV